MERIVLSTIHRGRKTNNWVIEDTSHRCDQTYQKVAEIHQQIMRQTDTTHHQPGDLTKGNGLEERKTSETVKKQTRRPVEWNRLSLAVDRQDRQIQKQHAEAFDQPWVTTAVQ